MLRKDGGKVSAQVLNQDIGIDPDFFETIIMQGKTACDLNLGKMNGILQILREKDAALKKYKQ